jgi:hypothetical protein
MKYRRIVLRSFILVVCGLSLISCRKGPPQHIENICKIFKQYPTWYWDAQQVQKRWGLPVYVLAAIIYQESHFNATAKPPRERLLWVIPWLRPTSAYGYSQAVKGTWREYKQATTHPFASRSAFHDAADFVGWYADQAYKEAGISKNRAYQVYLAYHEGIHGYQQKTYLKKKWLIKVAWKVEIRSNVYHAQLKLCQNNLPKKPFWRVW